MPVRVGRLKKNQKLAIYGVSLGLLLSGLVWLYFYYFVRVTDQFGFENPHPWQGKLMIAHAVVALPSIWIFGFLWHIHVKPGWRARVKRGSGGTYWSLVLWMILSGYSLYYIGSDTVRQWLSMGHWIAGIPATGLFLWHIRHTIIGLDKAPKKSSE